MSSESQNAGEGRICGIGIGPGDPELITLKGLRRLQQADVVAYPAPETGDSLARAIAAPHLSDRQREIVIRMPLSLDRFPVEQVYDEAAQEIGQCVANGQDVAVLCEGDPLFYGSFMYLYARLADRHEVEIIPGVSSLTAAAAMTRLALAARNDILTVLPAPLPSTELSRRLQQTDAAVIIKIGRHFERIYALLTAENLLSQATYVEHATMADQVIQPLAEVDGPAPYFSIILIHKRGAAWR